ncbi:MAG: lipid A deacylase LpxR family protein [Alphaproteobacteria bacterium]|nr:MAG: lipid A deacylase LpxR family protein [Alphaproteobacteria bacterium]
MGGSMILDRGFYRAAVVCAGVCQAGSVAYATESGGHEKHVITLQVENDLFFGKTDRDYTNGLRLSYVHHPDEVGMADKVSALLKKLSPVATGSPDADIYYTFGLGQNMYTPEDIEDPDLILDDRPYAGWTYLQFGVTVRSRHDFEVLELDAGIVGPASGAAFTQRQWHKLIGSPIPQGWSHQLPNEPGLNLHYFRGHRFVIGSNDEPGGWAADITPHGGLALGNIYTYGALGATFRFGSNLDRELGAPPRIQPSLPGSDYFGGSGLDFYVFAGAEARAMVRNIFLDGTWRDHEHDVDKKTMVADLQFGMVMFWDQVRIAITHAIRTKSYEGQKGGQEYGAITLSWRY